MRLPSKVTNYKESTLAKFSPVLVVLSEHDQSPAGLYKKVKSKIGTFGEYLEILDCLYALGKIQFNERTGVLHYVDTNQM